MKHDLDAVLDRIMGGDSQAEIARDIGLSPARLSELLSANAEIAERSARARSISAEAWLDRGLAVIESSLKKEDGIDASAAKAYAQECARRAAIRNPAYRDKIQQEISGPNGGPVQHEEVTRPKLTQEEWMLAHGVGTASRPAK
jgi:transcriptional regulator with XRE-family HTH domain